MVMLVVARQGASWRGAVWFGRHGGVGFVKARLRMVRFVMAGWDGKARCVMVR